MGVLHRRTVHDKSRGPYQSNSSWVFGTRFFTEPGPTNSATLVDLRCPGDSRASIPSFGITDIFCYPHIFTHVLGNQTQVLTFAQQTLHLLSHVLVPQG